MIKPLNPEEHEEHEEREDEVQAPIFLNLLNQFLIFKGSGGAELRLEHDEIKRKERGGV